DQFLIAIFDLTQRQHGADLGQRFHNQHTGHHGRAGKVALKKVLVDADLLDADDSFAGNQLHNSIDEEKGIAVRQELLNCQCVENCFHRYFSHKKAQEAQTSRLCSCAPLQTYSGGVVVVAAVAGFLLLKSAMNARVMSMLSAAYSKGTCAASMITLIPRALAKASSAL